MSTKIGIPRAMMFYRYYPLWSAFFRELGIEVFVSPPTSKRIIERGIMNAPEDTCLPVKVAMGHVEWLKDEADFIFIPRLVRTSPRYANCPKFLGLPDVIRADVSDLPPILDPIFDARRESIARTFIRFGRRFTRNIFKIKKAYKKASIEQSRFDQMVLNGVGVLEAMGFEKSSNAKPKNNESILIGAIGHPYNLYDRYTNMDVFNKLANMGARIATPDMLSSDVVESALDSIERPPYWELAREIVGSAIHFLNGHADGVIHLISFECGPDSLLQSLLEFENHNRKGIPYVPLVLDEHTGEAGIITRLEAFIDMITRKNRSSSMVG